jgi:FixJ family two-component response regulator
MILDDEAMICAVLTGIASCAGISSSSFQSGIQALDYLKGCTDTDLPRAYFVDMRIPGSQEELDSPELICNYLRSRGVTKDFYFMTGHISEHDEQVRKRTGAIILPKPMEMLQAAAEVAKRLAADKGT